MLTVNCDGSRVTEPLGGHVFSHACVIGCIRQLGVHYDQMAFAGDDEVLLIGHWTD